MSAPPPQPGCLKDYLNKPSPVVDVLREIHHKQEELIIMDVGACEGEDSIRYARNFPLARIFTFEPLPSNQELIRLNFDRYEATQAELIPLALADQKGEATFHVSSGHPPTEFSGKDWNYGNKSSSLLPPASTKPMHGWLHFEEKITVQTETLDNFARQRDISSISLIHLDVQGAEKAVLQGGKETLPQVGAIWLEVAEVELYRGQALRQEIEDMLRAAGFALILDQRWEHAEGDQLYINQRFPSHRRYMRRKKRRDTWARWRFRFGKWRNGLWHKPDKS